MLIRFPCLLRLFDENGSPYEQTAEVEMDTADLEALALEPPAPEPEPEPEPPAPEPEPEPEPPAPEPEPPAPEPEPEPGPVLSLEGDIALTNMRFIRPYQSGSGLFRDRLFAAEEFEDGSLRVGFGGAPALVLTGPGVENAEVARIFEREQGPVSITSRAPGRVVIEGDPVGDFFLYGVDADQCECVPAELENSSEHFDPAAIAYLGQFDGIRPMQMLDVNGLVKGADGTIYDDDTVPYPDGWWDNPVVPGGFNDVDTEMEWEDRQVDVERAGSQSWETMIDLANALVESGSRYFYINLPHQASLGYAAGLGALCRERLDTRIQPLVAHSNEVWNTQPSYIPAYSWCAARGLREGLQSGEVGGTEYEAAGLYHAKRTAELGAAFEAALGRPAHIVFEWFGANPWGAREMIELGLQHGRIDAYSIAPYLMSSDAEAALRNGASPQEVVARAEAGLLGEEGVFWQHEQAIMIADEYGLVPIWYEGGQHLKPYNDFWTPWDADLIARYQEVVEGPEMAALYTQIVDHWLGLGGGARTHYAEAAYMLMNEAFGLRRHYRQPATPAEVAFLNL